MVEDDERRGDALLELTIGVTVGVLAAYLGGRVEAAIMRLVDLQLSVPAVLIALMLVAAFSKATKIVIALIAAQWAYYARHHALSRADRTVQGPAAASRPSAAWSPACWSRPRARPAPGQGAEAMSSAERRRARVAVQAVMAPTGPDLTGTYGRPAGAVRGFRYSDAFCAATDGSSGMPARSTAGSPTARPSRGSCSSRRPSSPSAGGSSPISSATAAMRNERLPLRRRRRGRRERRQARAT